MLYTDNLCYLTYVYLVYHHTVHHLYARYCILYHTLYCANTNTILHYSTYMPTYIHVYLNMIRFEAIDLCELRLRRLRKGHTVRYTNLQLTCTYIHAHTYIFGCYIYDILVLCISSMYIIYMLYTTIFSMELIYYVVLMTIY